MFKAVDSRYLVPFEGAFDISGTASEPPDGSTDHKQINRRRKKLTRSLRGLQRRLYAQDRYSVLLVFQAMDAAGKDGTIRSVMSGVDPAGCQVFSFKKPSSEELDHDFLWRTSRCLPERGRIGIFNRSYYEEVLVVRVHPEYLKYQKLPNPIDPETVWEERFHSIREHELHLARSGTVIVKFFLNVSKDEQRRRLLSRLEEKRKRWKFTEDDVDERQHWDAYQAAFGTALQETSEPWAPWYAIPADDKPFMRQQVAEIVVSTLESLELEYPPEVQLSDAEMDAIRDRLAPGES
jgi:PPK2 family polyphosphate:nucleotide phosphotransferase